MADEYIRRQDAVDAVHEEFDGCTVWDESGERTADEVESIIDRVPSVDVAPVVRCKDCKFYTSMRTDIKTGICDLNVHHMGDDGFCSYGERKEA